MRDTIHATAICADGRAVLLLGPSGSGKSDLALRCIALPVTDIHPHPFRLIADDRVELNQNAGRVRATFPVSAPRNLIGHIEVRGVGIVPVPHVPSGIVALIVELSPPSSIERHPDPWPEQTLLGQPIPCLRLPAFEASTPHKVALALAKITPRQAPQSR